MRLSSADLVSIATGAGLALVAAAYAAGTTALLRRRSQPIVVVRAGSFVLGWLAFAVATLSPLAAVSEWLFSAHMTQHTLLMLVATPLVVAAQPVATMLSAGGTSRIGSAVRAAGPVLERLTGPAASFAGLLVTLWIWHLPALHEGALQYPALHAVQHLTFVAAAAAFWWGLVHGRYGRHGYGVAVAFVFLTAMHSSILGALLTVANRVLYPTYAARGAAHAVDAHADQQLAGLIMWIPSGVIFIVVGIALFAAWLGHAERQARLGSAAARPGGSR